MNKPRRFARAEDGVRRWQAALARQAELDLAIRMLANRYPACPKCRGQFSRVGWTCHCYQCCFEWDLREPVEETMVRARRRYQGERPDIPRWAEIMRGTHAPDAGAEEP